jgi:hypothetical protein
MQSETPSDPIQPQSDVDDNDRPLSLPARIRSRIARPSTIAHALALLIALYGALLRLDAFVGKYGALDHPTWARVATHTIAPMTRSLRPSIIAWRPEKAPYVGGDPITYIKYGREMRSFYQGHVREPVFVAMTRAGLWSLDDQDSGVSVASAAGSTAAIIGTYLVGAALVSPATGLIAAALMAGETEIVTWAVDGWRDDTFTATLLFAAWSLLRLRQSPRRSTALAAGVCCGLACLTRITAVSFIVPGLLWLLLERSRFPLRERLRTVAIAGAAAMLVVAPYLFNCALATGDPFVALNYHTTYYRFAEQRPIDQPMSAAGYVRERLVTRPLRTIDTAIDGVLVQPFVTKWRGFEPWRTGLGATLRLVALGGLALLLFNSDGRLFLVMLAASLVPYMLTWNVGGGGEWRFTMHAYPFFLVAAAAAVTLTARGLRHLRLPPARGWRPAILRAAGRVAVVAALAALIAAWYVAMPWYVIREAVAHGESTSIETGTRDRIFYRRGWSPPHVQNITVRVSDEQRGVIRLPLPEKRAYDLVLRFDPAVAGDVVNILFNRHLVGRLQTTLNPGRVGSYRLTLPRDIVTAGSNEIIVVPSTTPTAAAAGEHFAWLPPESLAGVRLWYVRVVPTAP